MGLDHAEDASPLRGPGSSKGKGDSCHDELLTSSDSKPINNFEDVLEAVGDLGKFQLMVLVLLFSLEIPTVFVVLLPVFTASPPSDWICVTEAQRFVIPFSESCDCNGTIESLDASATIVTEWKLTCDTVWVTDFITSVQMVGTLIGNVVSGSFSDWYGRRYTCLGSAILMGTGHLTSSFAPNAYVYAGCRFFAGVGFSGLIGVSAIYILEFLSTPYRQMCGAVGPWGLAIMSLGGIAYGVRPWRALTLVTSIPFAVLFLVTPLVPESPRWLLRNNKISQVYAITQRMARMNGKPQNVVTESLLQKIADSEHQTSSGTDAQTRATYMTLFRERELRLPTLCLMLIWFGWSCTYFFLSFNLKNMAGDPYLNAVLLGMTDAVGFPMGLLICNRLGRRRSVALCLTESALFLIALAICEVLRDFEVIGPNPILLLTLCLLGKFGMSVARGCIRTLTGESFPTHCRSMGSALSGVAASLGGIVAPQLAFLGTFSRPAPYFLISAISIAGAGVSFMLKETGGRPLKEGEAKLDKVDEDGD